MALKLDILANTRQFVGEMKKAGASTDDVSDALDDMAGEGKQAGDKLERSFKDIAKESERTGGKIGKELDDGFEKASRGAQDFKQESASTARESAASFDGSAESIAESFQEVAANAFAGFGPAGAVAGIAAAAGIGVVLSAITAQQEAVQRLKDYFSEAYESAAADGKTFLDAATIQAGALNILFDPDRAGEYAQILKDAAELGLDPNKLILAAAGDQKELNDVIQRTADLRAEAASKAEGEYVNLQRGQGLATSGLDQIASRYGQIGAIQAENAAKATRAQEIEKQAEDRRQAELKETTDYLKAMQAPRITPVLDTNSLNMQIRNYRPPKVFIPGRIVGNDGKQLVG